MARGSDIEECCDEWPLEGVLELELGSDVRSVSMAWGFGLLGGLELDMAEGDRVAGKRRERFAAVRLRCHVNSGAHEGEEELSSSS